MAVSLQVYESQVIQFLQSATIIFSPMAAQMNNILISSGYTVTEDQTTWKYYLNVSGQYHPADTPMYIQSLDTQQSVMFTTELLASSPVTAAAYTIGSSYYNNLCRIYPNQIDLIKSILYPVDINAAIAAPETVGPALSRHWAWLQDPPGWKSCCRDTEWPARPLSSSAKCCGSPRPSAWQWCGRGCSRTRGSWESPRAWATCSPGAPTRS